MMGKDMLTITPEELAALRSMADGRCRIELAAILDVPEPELDARLTILFRKMRVTTAREAADECVRRGLSSAFCALTHP
jgi:hypothetical protein